MIIFIFNFIELDLVARHRRFYVELLLFQSARRGEGKWILRFVSPVTGKRRDLGLGVYPATGIALARRLGLEARTLIAEGKDPIEARRMAEVEKRTAVSDTIFREAAERGFIKN